MKKIYLRILIVLLLFAVPVFSQAPNWQVDPSQFEMSMIATVVLKFKSGGESRNPNDKVAAYIGDQLVGVASPSIFVSSQDRYEANLIIYSNDEDSIVTFKMYKAASNVTTDALNQIDFVSDSSLGTVSSPYVISDGEIDVPALNFNNIITPNDDGYNDTLRIFDIDSFSNYELTIYDMNWQRIFRSSNYQNDWSGTDLKSGEYYMNFSGDLNNIGKVEYNQKIKIIK